MAWVANRSTTVRKAVTQITAERSNTPEERSTSPSAPFRRSIQPVSRRAPQFCRDIVTPGFAGEPSSGAKHRLDDGRSSHVLVVLVVQHVAHEQDDRLISQVLPPM